MDDTLLWSDAIEESFQGINWLDTCGRHEITLNPDKFCFAQDKVEFEGFEITNDTVQPCKRCIKAIADFPTPLSLTDVRSCFGLVIQVHVSCIYMCSMADTMLPLWKLLKPSTHFAGMKHFNKHSKSRKPASSMRSTTESNSLTKPNPHAWPQTGQNMALVIGCSRSIAPAHPMTSSAVNRAGRSPWWEADSHMLQNPDTPQLKEKH